MTENPVHTERGRAAYHAAHNALSGLDAGTAAYYAKDITRRLADRGDLADLVGSYEARWSLVAAAMANAGGGVLLRPRIDKAVALAAEAMLDAGPDTVVAATARCGACGATGVELDPADGNLMACVDLDACFRRQREEFAVPPAPPLRLVDVPDGFTAGGGGHARRAEDLASRALSVSMRGWWRRGRRRDMLAAATVHAILAARADRD